MRSDGRRTFAGVFISLALPAMTFSEGLAESISQDLALTVGQKATASGIREDGPLNRDNWQGRDVWEARMDGELEWRARAGDRAAFSFRGDMSWIEGASSQWGIPRGERARPEFRHDELLLSLSARDSGVTAFAGKTTRRYGSAVMMPVTDFLSVDVDEGEAGRHGKWMTGFSLFADPITVETWYAPIASWVPDEYRHDRARDGVDAMALVNVSALLGVNRVGAVYYHDGASAVALYWSGQVGDGLVPYAECAFSDRPLLEDFAPGIAPGRGDGASLDALAGFSFAPRWIDATVYAEYRYRSSGYGPDDWDALESALADPAFPASSDPASVAAYRAAMGEAFRDRGAVASSLPYFRASRHAAGLRIQNSRAIAGFLDGNLNVFYLAPAGFYLKVESSASFIDRLTLVATAEAMLASGSAGETAWWNETWRASLAAIWQVMASE